jgi:phenylpropionate dioxygenase-like ring-hydroxylating dioxygenase large terminal subunit
MKSAYGRTVPQENIELTHVEAGSPMGEVLRRYWQPVCLSSELSDLPKFVRIMCEDVVVFRTKNGRLGCLEPHCSHRGTSLEWGRVEDDGLRCCYHGWLYAPDGKVIDMVCEPAGVCERMNVEHPAYPVMEYGGLVFIYMGPPGTEPLFPLYDIIDTRYRKDIELRGMRIWGDHSIGYVKDCNWLQHFENILDTWHLVVLHQMISGDQFEGALMQGKPSISWDKTSLGICYNLIKDLPNGNRLVRHGECVVPNIGLVPNLRESGKDPKHEQRCSDLTWFVPVDNEHVTAMSIVAWPLEDGKPKADWVPDTDTVLAIRPGSEVKRTYEERQRKPDDLEAQESQRSIAIHALERLATTDVGLIQYRKLLREQVKAVQEGRDPMNVVRDAALNHRITTNAFNTVLAPEHAGSGTPW